MINLYNFILIYQHDLNKQHLKLIIFNSNLTCDHESLTLSLSENKG